MKSAALLRPALRLPALIFALVLAIGFGLPQPTIAQDVASGAVASRLDVRRQPAGTLSVDAANASLDDVIRQVAAAANITVTVVGAAPADRVTIAFVDSAPAFILRELMDAAGISYVLASGSPDGSGRLVMGLLPAKPIGPWFVAEASLSESQLAQEIPVEDMVASGTGTDDAPPRTGPVAWPPGVPLVNPGPVVLPDSLETMFLMVNGREPVSLPSTATPNAPGTRPPAIESVNMGRPFAPLDATSQPGVVSSSYTVTAVSHAPVIDPAMLEPFRIVQIPAPVVVTFSTPPR